MSLSNVICCVCRQIGSTGGSSATAYRSGGDAMSNVELLNTLLAIAGLVVGVISLTLTFIKR